MCKWSKLDWMKQQKCKWNCYLKVCRHKRWKMMKRCAKEMVEENMQCFEVADLQIIDLCKGFLYQNYMPQLLNELV